MYSSVYIFYNYSVILQVFIIIFSVLILLLPLLFWMYVFTSFSSLGVSRGQFLIGIIAWVISTLPLIYQDMFIIWNLLEEIFFSLSFVVDSFFWTNLIVPLSLFFLSILIVSFIISYWLFSGSVRSYIRSTWGIIFLLCVSSFSIFIVYTLAVNIWVSQSIESGSFVFTGLGAIWWYYIIIALLEEGMKYSSNLSIIPSGNNLNFNKMLITAWVIALGFAFFENILYVYSYLQFREIDSSLLQITFFRSLFTIALHILCSMIFAAWFYMLLALAWKYNKAYLLFGVFSLLAIVSHAFFDIAITFWYIWVVFIYLFLLYIFVGYITMSD